MNGYPWEHALDFLQAAGWSYRRKTLAPADGAPARECVEISRDGLSFALCLPTLDETVGALYGIATLVERGEFLPLAGLVMEPRFGELPT